ncbi:MAG: hypothetical protein L0346_03015 [Chloroflexi bacterium]|nr:hypothetical protein [Chloroflexota bacterium]
MSEQYDLEVIRRLLGEAFDAGEVSNLAFDLFQEVYQNFTAGMTRDQMIRSIVAHADERGRIPDLLAYVARHNPYRYQQYADQLKPVTRPAPNPPPDYQAQRLRDVQQQIEADMALLRQYEEQLRLADDPRQIMRIKREIERQRESLANYQREAAELAGPAGRSSEPVASEVRQNVQAMGQALDALDRQVTEAESREKAVEEEELRYQEEEQPWYAGVFPAVSSLEPDQAMALQDEVDVVIMTATEVELKAFMRLLKPYPGRKRILRVFIGPETYYLGRFGVYKAVVTQCGIGAIGEDAVILAAEQALRVWQPLAVIMAGIAFGRDSDKQKMADVLVATQIISYEPQRVGERTIFRGSITPSNVTLLNRFRNAHDWHFQRPDGQPCRIHFGPLLSGEKLVDDPTFKAALLEQFPTAIGGEMEGAGLTSASGRVGTPSIVVKAISDWADGKKHGKHQPLAAAATASLVHHVLSQKAALPSSKRPHEKKSRSGGQEKTIHQAEKDESEPAASPGSLAEILAINPEHEGVYPYKAGPGQWFVRLEIESKKPIKDCWGLIYKILQLNDENDIEGKPLPESEATILSWADNLFEPISIESDDLPKPKYLDLAWRANGDPPIPADELRIASSRDRGKRDTSLPLWGMRQDFIPLKPGYYLLIIRISAAGYAPIELKYRLHWPGPGKEDEIRWYEVS